MAEYYPLLERAIAGLQDATPASRAAVYVRARTALLGQLRAMKPPVPEDEIQRESVALDEAIARLERRFGTEKPRAASNALAATRPASSRPEAVAPGLPPGKAAPVVPPPVRERPVLEPRGSASPPRVSAARPPGAPSGSTRAGPAVPLPPTSGRTPETAARIGSVTKPDAPSWAPPSTFPIASDTDETAPAVPPFDRSPPSSGSSGAGSSPVLPTAPRLEVPVASRPAQDRGGWDSKDEIASRGNAPGGTPEQGRDDVRPAAPRPATVEPRSVGFYVVACLACVLVLGIAVAAWKLRDRPEQVAAARTENASPETPGKLVDRVGGDTASEPAREPEPSSDSATVPAPIPQSSEPSIAPASEAQPAPATETTSSTASIPVSQRAALLVDAPEDQQKVKTYVGSVVWRSESVSPGQGQPLSTAVRADVDVPDAKLTMSMVLKKNLEAQFPASHTMEFHFTELPGNTLGPIKQVNVPEMRKDDSAPTGEPLTGVPVSITDDYFLVGLSRGGAELPNLQMMADRNWIDLSVLLTSGKVAKITFEKGTSGQQILEGALKSWQ